MKRTEPLRLGAIIDQMMTRAAADPATRSQYICGLWPRVAGPHIAAYTCRVRLEGRLLHVDLSSASLKEQLGYMREALTQQLNAEAGENAIDNIIIH